MRLGIITGTGAGDLAARWRKQRGDEATNRAVPVSTRAGEVLVDVISIEEREVVLLGRHGRAHSVPPHAIDHHANMDAMLACNVEGVIGLHNTGSLNLAMGPGHLVVPDDLNALLVPTPARDPRAVVHIDLLPPFCRELRSHLIAAAKANHIADQTHTAGTYVGVPGPRLESPAEARFLGTLGDVVGMTGAQEAIASREAGLAYASLAFVANSALGSVSLPADEMRDALAAARATIDSVLHDTVQRVPLDYVSSARDVPARGRFS